MNENDLSRGIIGAAIEVHQELGGPGLLESVYEEALCLELALRAFNVQRQVPVPISYKGQSLKTPLYLDVLVNGKIIVEVKATEKHNTIFEAQLLTYLRLTGLKLGLVINFGEKRVVDGIHRVVNKL
ncbi:MAG: GxxExxY protein [SAR324 cluster bacterium]|nr:GxxExxY protein [SAR324 cluster bacterium]